MSDAARQLSAALLEAQRNVRTLPKDARNEFGEYDYTSAESIIVEARRVLHDAGLIAYRRRWELMAGPPMYIMADFVIEHAASGERIETQCVFPVVESRGQPLNKATAAALTSCLAYWLRDLLLIPRIDVEMDSDGGAPAAPMGRVAPAQMPVPTEPQNQRRSHTSVASSGASPKVWTEPPKTLAELGQMLLAMAGGDKAKASAICQELLGVSTLKDYSGFLPEAIDTVWQVYKDYVNDATPEA